jgi:hypothetical protein
MSDDATRPVHLHTGLPSTVLPEEPAAARDALRDALAADPADRRDRVAQVVAAHPRWSEAWAGLGDHGRDTIERYAAYRIGYHRGLDSLRANGWRGSGYVRWSAPTNRGFLRCLVGLGRMAAEIGEHDEVERITVFLAQLDPSGVPADV